MIKMKWKNVVTLLCLALIVSIAGSLFIGFYEADAAISSVTITFGSTNSNWRTYLDPYSGPTATSLATDTTIDAGEYVGPRTTFKENKTGKTIFHVDGTDPGIYLDFSGISGGLKIGDDYVVHVRYAFVNESFELAENGNATSFTGQSEVFFWNTSNNLISTTSDKLTIDFDDTISDHYAIISDRHEMAVNKIRIDIPAIPSSITCTMDLHIEEIYIGPRSGSPVKKVTYEYNTSPTATTTKEEYLLSGAKPVSVPSVSSVENSSTKLVPANKWKKGSTTLTAATIKNTAITTDTTYVAQYTTQYKVNYRQLKSSYDDTELKTTESEWVTAGGSPTKAKSYTNVYTATDSLTRYALAGWSYKGTIISPEEAAAIEVNEATDLWAWWPVQYRIRFLGVDSSGSHTVELAKSYVISGKTVSTVWSTLPKVDTIYNKGTEASSSVRYVHSAGDVKWVNKDAVGRTAAQVLNTAISMSQDFKAFYDTQYPVRYLNGSTVLETDWIVKGNKNTEYNGDTPTKSGYNHVGWVRSSSTSTPAATANAERPGITAITAATYYHARFLSDAFVGKSSNNLVVERSITLQPGTTDAENKYRMRIDVYHYGGVVTDNELAGAMKGYFTLTDNIKADFFKNVTVPEVYTLNYLGNGRFDGDDVLNTKMANADNGQTGWNARLTNGGSNGFVFKMFDIPNNTELNVWGSRDHFEGTEPDHRYFEFHFSDGDVYSNELGNSASDYRSLFYCREYAGSSTNNPRGFKYVIIVDFELDRDGTIGGNNVPISHEEEDAYLKYYSPGSAPNSDPLQTIDFLSLYTSKNQDWPNANIEILYDFCPHDYYMDLYDKKTTQIITNGKMNDSIGTTTIPGLITILRDRAVGNHGDNNRKVYGNLFTHGNMPVYARSKEVVNEYNKEGLPNTDVNGVRNEKVIITYSVYHDTMKTVVYETKCEEYKTAFEITNQHDDVIVDFLKDHSVTITATVTPTVIGHTDSFGRPSADTPWTKTAKAYYFAPRIAVADTSNNIPVRMQREACSYSHTNFTAMPSIIYGTRDIPKDRILSTDPSGGYSPSGSDGKTYLLYSFGDTYTYRSTPHIMKGIEKVPYTVQAINTPKRFEGSATMENRDIIQRYFYIIPSTAMTYDQNSLTFTNPSNWLMSTEANSRVSRGWQQYYNYPLYGYDKNLLVSLRDTTENSEKTGNLLDYNGGSLYTNVDDTTTEDRNEWGEFTFTGTGFDIYSRTGPDTGVLVAQVYEGTTLLQNIFSDTYLDQETYYQVPCIQWRAKNSDGSTKHGTFTVKFRAYYHSAFDHALYSKGRTKTLMTEEKICQIMGWDSTVPCSISLSDAPYAAVTRATKSGDYDVYIDGIRIYNTMGTLSEAADPVYDNNPDKENYAAYAIYHYDKEVNPKYYNVNEYLVDAERSDWFKELGTTDASGMLYIAANGGSDTGSGENFVGINIGMSGEIYTQAVDYTESSGGTYIKYYLLDEKGNRIKDKTGKYNIFLYSKNNKYYKETSPWTALTSNELMLECGNKIAFYDDNYKAAGPEFEVYLSSGNGVAFNATGSANSVTSVHISLRSANGGTIAPQIYDGSSKSWKDLAIEYPEDYTELYYDVTSYVKSNNGNLYIRNKGTGVMSVMNIKVVGGSAPTVNTRMILEALTLFRGEAETPVEDESVKIYHTLNLASDISLNYVVPMASLGDIQSSYLTVELPVYEKNSKTGSRSLTLYPTVRGGNLYYTLDGLTAVNLRDEISAQLHFIKDGAHYVSAIDHYSIATYAYSQLNKTEAGQKLKELCADLLRYGAETQIFKSYRSDALANSEMTELHASYLSDLKKVTFGTLNEMQEDMENAPVTWVGKALNLESKIGLIFVVDPGEYAEAPEKLSLQISYINQEGLEENVIVSESIPYGSGGRYRAFHFSGLLAAQMRSELSIAVYEEEAQVSSTLLYAADSYANGKDGQLLQVCKALFAYVDSANRFFEQ